MNRTLQPFNLCFSCILEITLLCLSPPVHVSLLVIFIGPHWPELTQIPLSTAIYPSKNACKCLFALNPASALLSEESFSALKNTHVVAAHPRKAHCPVHQACIQEICRQLSCSITGKTQKLDLDYRRPGICSLSIDCRQNSTPPSRVFAVHIIL